MTETNEPWNQEERRFHNLADLGQRSRREDQVVTPEMHYGLARLVDGIEKRMTSSEFAVHELSRSHDVTSSHLTGWFKVVGDSMGALRSEVKINTRILCIFGMAHLITLMLILYVASHAK